MAPSFCIDALVVDQTIVERLVSVRLSHRLLLLKGDLVMALIETCQKLQLFLIIHLDLFSDNLAFIAIAVMIVIMVIILIMLRRLDVCVVPIVATAPVVRVILIGACGDLSLVQGFQAFLMMIVMVVRNSHLLLGW